MLSATLKKDITNLISKSHITKKKRKRPQHTHTHTHTERAERVPFYIEQTGGGVKFHFNTGFYELLKNEQETFFSWRENTMRCVRIPVSDSKGNITECIYKIYGTDGHLYTVNMYHTRSSSLVNGKSVSLFLQPHFVSVLESMKNCMNTKVEEVNRKIKAILLQCRKVNASKDSNDFEPFAVSDHSGKSPLTSISEISENDWKDKEETIIRRRSKPLLSKSNNGRNVDSTTPNHIDFSDAPLNISLDRLIE